MSTRSWPRFAGRHLTLTTGDVVALWVALDLHAARRAGEQLVEVVLHAAEPVVVGADEAHHRRRRPTVRGRSGATRPGTRCRRGRGRGPAWRSTVVDLAGDVRERALLVRQPLLEFGLVDLHDRRQLRRVHERILDHPRVGDDRGLRHRHREHLAGAVEDVPALGGDGDGADPLPERRATTGASGRAPAGRTGARRWRRTRARSPARCRARRARMGGSGGPDARLGRRGGARAEPAPDGAPAARGAPAPGCAAAHRGAQRARAAPRAGRRAGGGTAAGAARDHGCWGPRLGFVFDQSAIVSAVEPSSVAGSGAFGTSRSGRRLGRLDEARGAGPPG